MLRGSLTGVGRGSESDDGAEKARGLEPLVLEVPAGGVVDALPDGPVGEVAQFVLRLLGGAGEAGAHGFAHLVQGDDLRLARKAGSEVGPKAQRPGEALRDREDEGAPLA